MIDESNAGTAAEITWVTKFHKNTNSYALSPTPADAHPSLPSPAPRLQPQRRRELPCLSSHTRLSNDACHCTANENSGRDHPILENSDSNNNNHNGIDKLLLRED
jgi:hypothetical protein